MNTRIALVAGMLLVFLSQAVGCLPFASPPIRAGAGGRPVRGVAGCDRRGR